MLHLTLPLTHDQVFFVCYTELIVKVFFVCYSRLVARYFLYVTLDMPLTPLHLTLVMVFFVCYSLLVTRYFLYVTLDIRQWSRLAIGSLAPLSQVTGLCMQMACADPICRPIASRCPPPLSLRPLPLNCLTLLGTSCQTQLN
jgi:hypothetical protein